MALPVSKSGPFGTGKVRRLRCACAEVGAGNCAAHALADQVRDLEQQHACRRGDEAAWGVPLFPTKEGKVATKQEMIAD